MMKMRLWFMWLIVSCLSVSVWADLIAYEGFDYPMGANIEDQSGGQGWVNAWKIADAGGALTVGEPLNYPDLVTTGNSFSLKVDSSLNLSSGIERQMSQTIGADGTTVWASILVHAIGKVGNSDSKIYAGDNGALAPGTKWWYEFAIDNDTNGTKMSADKTYLIVWRNVFSGGQCTTTMWVDPDTSMIPSDSTAIATKTSSWTETDIIKIRANHYDDHNLLYDEFRMATTFEEAVPSGFILTPESFDYTTEELTDPNSPFTTTGEISAETGMVQEGTASLKAVLAAGDTLTKVTGGVKYDYSKTSGDKMFGFWFKGDSTNAPGNLVMTFLDPNAVANKATVTFENVMTETDWVKLEVQIPANDPTWNNIGGIQFATSSDGVIYLDMMDIAKPEANLVLHWSFNEGNGTTTADMSGNGIDGTVSGTGASWTVGHIGQDGDYAIEFDGVDPNAFVSAEGIDLSALPVDDIFKGDSSWTISMWYKSLNNSGIQMLGGFGRCSFVQDGPLDERYLDNWGGGLEFQPGGNDGLWPGANLPENEWVLLTITYDKWDRVAKMYVGTEMKGAKAYTFADVSEKTVQVGNVGKVAWTDNGNNLQTPLNAVIDDFKLFDQALTEKQVIEMSDNWVCIDKPAVDLNDDCMVDVNDFAIFATHWLDCGRFPATFCN